MIKPALCLLILMLVCGCDDIARPLDEVVCDPSGTVDLQMSGVRREGGVVHVTGSARSSSGTAIRGIVVAGQPVMLEDFNFQRFSVDLEGDQLPRLGTQCAADMPQATCLPARIERACGDPLTPNVVTRIVRVAVELTSSDGMLLGEQDLIVPADGSSPIEVDLAAASSVHVVLRLDTPRDGVGLARFRSLAGPTQLELDADPTAATTIVGSRAGLVVLSIDAPPDALQQFAIVVAGVPAFFPDGGAVPAGEPIEISVEADGGLTGCAWAGGGTSVSFVDDIDPEAESATFEGPPSVRGTVVLPAGSAPVTIRCRDTFGQQGEAAFSISPP